MPLRITLTTLAFLSLIQGCASPLKSTSPLSHPLATDEDIVRWYEQAKPLVSAKLSVDLSKVGIDIQDKTQMHMTHQALSQRHIEKRFQEDEIKKMIERQVEYSLSSTIALYDPDNTKIVVDRKNFADHMSRLEERGHSPEQAALTVLIHELIHAADDANYDLNAIHAKKPWSGLTISAVLEGHAQQATEEICEEINCLKAFEDDENFLRSLPALTGTGKLMPTLRGDNIALRYVQGANFLRQLKQMTDGDSLVKRALKEAPGDVLTLFNPKRFLDPSIARSSDKLAAALNSSKMNWLSHWIKSPESVFTQSSFPRRDERRERYVQAKSERLLGSAMTNYYPANGNSLTPITVKLLRARNPAAAKQEAVQMLNDVRHNTAGILGWSLKLHDIKTWTEDSVVGKQPLLSQHFKALVVDDGMQKNYPYQVTVLQLNDYIAEISSFETPVVHNRAIDILKTLIGTGLEAEDTLVSTEETRDAS